MKLFICYDKKQRRYFIENGFNDVVYGLHPKTLKPFWIYERNKKFDECFENWLRYNKSQN